MANRTRTGHQDPCDGSVLYSVIQTRAEHLSGCQPDHYLPVGYALVAGRMLALTLVIVFVDPSTIPNGYEHN